MRIEISVMVFTFTIAILLGFADSGWATKGYYKSPFIVQVTSTENIVEGQQLTIDYNLKTTEFWSNAGKDKGTLSIAMWQFYDRRDTIYTNAYPLDFDETHSVTIACQLPIQTKGNVIEVEFVVNCDHIQYYPYSMYLVPSGDSIIFTENYIPPPCPQFQKMDMDTLTEENLAQACNVYVYIDSLSCINDVEKILNIQIADSTFKKMIWGQYQIEVLTTLGGVFRLHSEGFRFEYAIPPPWSELYFQEHILKPCLEEQERLLKKNPGDEQGAINEMTPIMMYSDIELDHIDGISQSGILPTGKQIIFYLRARNTTGTQVKGICNGFRIFSDDGANWGTTSIDTISLGWDSLFDFYRSLATYSTDGMGSDTVGFYGIALGGPGLTVGFDDILCKIEMGPIDSASEGLHLTLDSSFFGFSGYWQWSDSTGGNPFSPSWGGPYNFTICNSITFAGKIKIYEPIPPDTTAISLNSARVEMWEYSQSPYNNLLLDSCTTDDSGFFSLGPIQNNDPEGGDMDIFLKIYAENEAVYVTSIYNGSTISYSTSLDYDIPSGIYDTTIIIPLNNSGPFFIANTIYEGYDNWYSYTGDNIPKIQAVSNSYGTGTNWVASLNRINIEGKNDPGQYYPDTFDKDIILHEYGHVIESKKWFFCSSPGGPHSWSDTSGMELAASEAFAHYFSALSKNNDTLYDFADNFKIHAWLNLESGANGFTNKPIINYANNYGAKCEGAVAGILWDIIDNDITIDDHSTYQWPPLPATINYDSADGTGDTLIACTNLDIVTVLINYFVNGNLSQNIEEFWDVWFISAGKNHGKAMTDIWYEHGINRLGDANNDRTLNMGDAIYVINYIFIQGSPPIPLALGDANCDHTINIGDPIYLINYIFRGGPPPCP